MINITVPFSNEIKKDGFTYREYITVGADTKKILVKAKLFDDCYFEGNFVGTFIMKRIEIETESDIDYKQKEITFYKGVKVGANWEDLKIGTFIVTDISLSDTKELVKITGYDYALKFAKPYVTALNYASGTITLQMVLDEITTALGIAKTALDINGGFIVDSNQFEGQQYGNVIQAIALSTGNFAKIDQNNNLKFILKTPTDIIINDYVELEDKRDTHPITIVALGMSQIEGENVTLRWEQGITLYGEHYLVINDNPFTYTQQKRQQQIQAIFDKIKGFAYSSFSTKSAFAPQVQCGDLVKIKNRAGTLVESIILRYSSDYDDILLEAPSIIKATVNYQNEPSLELQIKETQIKVDKANNEIIVTNKKIEELNSTMKNEYSTKVELSNTIKQTVGSTENNISVTGGDNIIRNPRQLQNSDGWEVKDGTVYEVITDDNEIESNTTCKSEAQIKNGQFSQVLSTIIGKQYTITFRYKHPVNDLKQYAVSLYRTDVDKIDILSSNLLITDRTECSYTYIATVNSPKIVIKSDNTDFRISDLVLRSGTSKEYTDYSSELRGASYKLDKDNYTHFNLATGEKGMYDSNDIKYYSSNGTLLADYGARNCIVNTINATTTINIGELSVTKVADGNYIVI